MSEHSIMKNRINTIGTDEAVYSFWPFTNKGKLTSVKFMPDAALTTNETNYVTFNLKLDGTTVASIATNAAGTGSLVAGTEVAVTITGAGTALEVDEGDQIAFDYVHAASGIASEGEWVCLFEEIR